MVIVNKKLEGVWGRRWNVNAQSVFHPLILRCAFHESSRNEKLHLRVLKAYSESSISERYGRI